MQPASPWRRLAAGLERAIPFGTHAPRVLEVDQLPWHADPASTRINLAFANFVKRLPDRLTLGGRIHAETFLAASGAVAGYTAQRALLAELGGLPDNGFQVVKAGGERYLFGEPLNQMLFAQSDNQAGERLWPLAAGAAVAAGLPAQKVPSPEGFFTHVASTIGSKDEGRSSLEKYEFHGTVLQLLQLLWPLALKCFNSELSGAMLKPTIAVPQRWRPVVAARAVHTFIQRAAVALPPADALTIVMEAAVYGSKLDPLRVGSD